MTLDKQNMLEKFLKEKSAEFLGPSDVLEPLHSVAAATMHNV